LPAFEDTVSPIRRICNYVVANFLRKFWFLLHGNGQVSAKSSAWSNRQTGFKGVLGKSAQKIRNRGFDNVWLWELL
jgi:hypothetical protein